MAPPWTAGRRRPITPAGQALGATIRVDAVAEVGSVGGAARPSTASKWWRPAPRQVAPPSPPLLLAPRPPACPCACTSSYLVFAFNSESLWLKEMCPKEESAKYLRGVLEPLRNKICVVQILV